MEPPLDPPLHWAHWISWAQKNDPVVNLLSGSHMLEIASSVRLPVPN